MYSVAQGRVLALAALRACAGRSRARDHIPARGPVILASNHVSYLDPLTLAYVADRRGRRVRFLAKAELFDKRGLGPLLRGRAPDPGAARHAPTRPARSTPRSTRCDRGECVAVFPEGTISLDLEPMAREVGHGAARAGEPASPVVPVGLWGTHRILMKGRKPTGSGASRRSPSSARRSCSRPTSTCRQATDRIMDAIADVRRRGPARSTRSARAPDDDAWWWRDPETARRRTGGRRDDRTRVAVIGAGSWGTAVAAIVGGNAPTTLWARRAGARRAASTREHENPDYLPGIALPDDAARDRVARGGVRGRRRGRDRRAVARLARGARRRRGRTSAPDAADREPRQGHRAGHARADDRGRREVLADHDPTVHRRAHRPEPRARGRGRSADRVGGRDRRRRGRRASSSACSSRRRSASTRTPMSSAARWRAR